MADAENAQLAALAAAQQAGFAAIDKRLDRLEMKVDTTNGQVARAHERASTHDAILANLNQEVSTLRMRMHDFANQLHKVIFGREMEKPNHSGDNKRITQRDVRVFLIGGGALVAAVKFVEWAAQHGVVRP